MSLSSIGLALRKFPAALLCFLILAWSGGSQAGAASQKVLLIHSYNRDMLWVREISRGIREELGEGFLIEEHFLDTKRISPTMFSAATTRALEHYRAMQPDLVILSDDNALNLLGNTIASRTPVIFCGINGDLRRDFPWAVANPNITGVMERPMIRRAIREVVEVTGIAASKVLVLIGVTPTGEAYFSTDLNGRPRFSIWKGLEAEVRRSSAFDDWRQWTTDSREQGYQLIMVAELQSIKDDRGARVEPERVSRWLSENSPVPVFTVHDQFISVAQLVGGLAIDGKKMGAETAALAKKILAEQSAPGDLPILFETTGTLIFSRKQLERWNLSVADKYKGLVKLVY